MAVNYFRVMSEKYYRDPYSAGRKAGRWNYEGQGMIYLASTPSLAMLEYLTIKGPVVGDGIWFMITFEIKDEQLIDELDVNNLPSTWNSLPHPVDTKEFGKQWLKEMASPFVKVPSARLNISFYSHEHNLLVNPSYPGLTELLKVIEARQFTYMLGNR